jgi:hypothetical protein
VLLDLARARARARERERTGFLLERLRTFAEHSTRPPLVISDAANLSRTLIPPGSIELALLLRLVPLDDERSLSPLSISDQFWWLRWRFRAWNLLLAGYVISRIKKCGDYIISRLLPDTLHRTPLNRTTFIRA